MEILEDFIEFQKQTKETLKDFEHELFQDRVAPHSEKIKYAISMTKKGSKYTKEHKKNISKGLMGHIQPQSQKDKVRIKKSKWWYITYPDGKTEKIFNLNEFAKQHNLDQGNLVKVSQGVLKQHKKYVCKQA